MANGVIKNNFVNKFYSSTGIANVTAEKNGKEVELNIGILNPLSGTASSWIDIGTLIEELRPATTISFMIQDNIITNRASGIPYFMRLRADGKLSLWVYTDKTTDIRPVGSILYNSAN